MNKYFLYDQKFCLRIVVIVLTFLGGSFFGAIVQKYYPLGYAIQYMGQISRIGLMDSRVIPTIQSTKIRLTEIPSIQPSEVMNEKILCSLKTNNLSLNDRDKYKRVIHLYGDSIARGWGFGVFEHENQLSRIQDIVQILLRDNGVNFYDIFIRYAWSQSVDNLKYELDSGMIREGDVVIWEDAGPHENDIEKRRKLLTSIQETLKVKGRKISLVLTTMFDYWPALQYYNSEYDACINESEITMNKIIFETASNRFSSVLDWNLLMDQAVESLRRYGVNPMHRDGVHPNIFGNFLLAISLLQHLGIEVTNYESVKGEFIDLPGTYHIQLQWAMPLSELQVEKVLETLFNISNDHYNWGNKILRLTIKNLEIMILG